MYTGPGGYFNECMNGFEYQVAAHMVYEGEPGDALVEKGLAIAKAVHERYGADKRNPYNEIECSDHYARAMASYGVFISICGFEYHGPKGHIAFSPRLTPENFKAPFITAEGWGTYTQSQKGRKLTAKLEIKWGQLKLRSIALVPSTVIKRATVNGHKADFEVIDGQTTVQLPGEHIVQGESLVVELF